MAGGAGRLLVRGVAVVAVRQVLTVRVGERGEFPLLCPATQAVVLKPGAHLQPVVLLGVRAGTVLVELYQVLLVLVLALYVDVGEPVLGAALHLSVQVEVGDVVDAVDGAVLGCEVLLEQRGEDHQVLVKVLRGAGSRLVDGGGSLLQLQDVLRPLEYSQALEHLVTLGRDRGDHHDVVLLLPLHHLDTASAGELVAPVRDGAVVAQGEDRPVLAELVLAGEAEAEQWPHLNRPGGEAADFPPFPRLLLPGELEGAVAGLGALEVAGAAPVTGLSYLDAPPGFLHQETPHSLLVGPLVAVVQRAHHVGLLVVQVALPGGLAGQHLLAVALQAYDGVVEHGVAGLLLHVLRADLELEQTGGLTHTADNL